MNALLGLLGLLATAQVGEPAEQRAYQLTVCIRASSNPVLTPLMVDSVRRQTHDQLTTFFGRLATVQVRTADNWLIDNYRDQSVDQPNWTSELFAEHPIEGKVLLVTIDYRDGQYRIASRRIDALTRQAGEVSERETPDRQWVAKAVCLAVTDDFGLVADVQRSPIGGVAPVAMSFRGFDEQKLWNKLVPEQSFWQPFMVFKRRDGSLQRQPVPYTIVQVDRKRTVEPQVYSSAADPFPQRAAIVGIEAVKLRTSTGRVRLRIIDKSTRLAIVNCSVAVNDRGFDKLTDADLLDRPNRDGYVTTRGPLRNVAFVRVATGGAVEFKFPLPITRSWNEFELPVVAEKNANEKNDFQRMLLSLRQDLHLIDDFHADATRRFNELYVSKRYEDALKLIEQSREGISPKLADAEQTLRELQAMVGRMGDSAAKAVESVGAQVASCQQGQKVFAERESQIKQVVTTGQAQSRADVFVNVGHEAEQKGDIEQAITNYEAAIKERADQPVLQQRLDRMKKIWSVDSPARKFVYDQWSQAELTKLAELLPEAERSFQSLKTSGDYLAGKKLFAANEQHVGQLSVFLIELADQAEADKAEVEKYTAISEKLTNFQVSVAAFLESAEPMDNAPPSAPTATDQPAEPPAATNPRAPEEGPASPMQGTPAPAEEAPSSVVDE